MIAFLNKAAGLLNLSELFLTLLNLAEGLLNLSQQGRRPS